MTQNVPNPASAAAQTGSGNAVYLGGERLPNTTPPLKFQAQIFPEHPASRKRLSWSQPKTADHPAMFGQERSTNETTRKANRVCRQDVLDCPRHGSPSWFYYGPLPDGIARAFVQQKKAAWKALLRTERAKRKAALAA
jgi:hypothetical protein